MSQLRRRTGPSGRKPEASARRPTLIGWLEPAVLPLEEELSRQPLMAAILAGTITREDYQRVLQGLLSLHQCAERCLDLATHMKAFHDPEFRRAETLRRDLRYLRGRIPVRNDPAIERFESHARRWADAPGAGLVGFLLQMERLRRAPSRRVSPLSKALGTRPGPHCGLDYHLEGAAQAERRYIEMCDRLNTGVPSKDRAHELREGCVETVRALIGIHGSVARRPGPGRGSR